MFTVKHIGIGGDESLFSVATVRYTPRDHEAVNCSIPATVWVRDVAGEGERPLTGGTIFVMNDKGSTVARYDLGASPVPHIGGVEEPKTWREPKTGDNPNVGRTTTIAA